AGFSHTFDKLEKISVHESFHTGALPANDGIVAELKNRQQKRRFYQKHSRKYRKSCLKKKK
ncbi:hypothetical protein UM89_21750, partial [Bacillus subtilis]